MDDPGLWTVVKGALPGIGFGGIAFYQLYKKWREGRDEEKRDRREIDIIDRRRALLDGRADILVDQLERRIAEVERERDELRYDRDRGWNTARYFEGLAHEVRHAFRNVLMARQIFDVDIPVIPGLEDPYPKRPE